MGSDLLVAVAVVMAVLLVRTTTARTVRAVRAVRRLRRRSVGVIERVRRGEAVASDPRWWANQRDRRRMWRSVAAADRAVSAAVAAGVPTGDLRSVVRRLRAAARQLDAGLASPHRSAQLQQQTKALANAADAVARAAADAVAADAAPLVARVVEAAHLESAALR
jgi:exonuclease SbcC